MKQKKLYQCHLWVIRRQGKREGERERRDQDAVFQERSISSGEYLQTYSELKLIYHLFHNIIKELLGFNSTHEFKYSPMYSVNYRKLICFSLLPGTYIFLKRNMISFLSKSEIHSYKLQHSCFRGALCFHWKLLFLFDRLNMFRNLFFIKPWRVMWKKKKEFT